MLPSRARASRRRDARAGLDREGRCPAGRSRAPLRRGGARHRGRPTSGRRAPVDREGAEPAHHAAEHRVAPELCLRHVADRPGGREPEQPRVDHRLVVGDEDDRAGRRNPLGAAQFDAIEAREPPPEVNSLEERVEGGASHLRLPAGGVPDSGSSRVAIRDRHPGPSPPGQLGAAAGHGPAGHEPHQPARHAGRGGRPAARASSPRQGSCGTLRSTRATSRSWPGCTSSARSASRRLPSLLHAPRLRDPRAGEGGARDPRLHDDAGPADPVGDRPPQAPRALGRRGRPALAPRATATARSRPLKGFVHAHVGWMFTNLGMEQGRIYGSDLYDDRHDPHDRPALPALGRR